MGIKTKLKELVIEKEQLQRRWKERETGFMEARHALRKEMKEEQEERNSLRRKVEGLESKLAGWKDEKSSLEALLR